MILNLVKSIVPIAVVTGVASAAFCSVGSGFAAVRHGKRTGAFMKGGSESRIFGNDNNNNEGHFNGDHFDMEELRQRIFEQNNPYNALFQPASGTIKKLPEDVHIILFNPNTEQEGVHTIEYPKGSGNNVILAFESKKECERFAGVLKDQGFFDPTITKMEMKHLETYCDTLGVFVQVVPEGVEINPPTESVKKFGHNPELKRQQAMLDFIFEMGETEPDEDGVLVCEDFGSWE